MSNLEIKKNNFIDNASAQSSRQRISVNEIMTIFKTYKFKAKNYSSIVKKYLVWCSQNQVALNEFSVKAYLAILSNSFGNISSYKTPINKLLQVAKEQKLLGLFVYQETETKPFLESILEVYFESFLQNSQRSKSQKTKMNYRNSFKEFCKFCQVQDVHQFTFISVQKFRAYMIFERNAGKKSNFTVNAYLSPLRQFSKYLILNSDTVFSNLDNSKRISIERDLDKISLIQGETIETGTYFKDSLDHEEVLRVIEAMGGTREKLIVGLMYFAGLRTFETLKVELKDFNRTSQTLTVIGKGGKKGIVALVHCWDSIERLLNNYLKENNIQEGQLFPSLNHTSQIRRFVNETLKQLNLKEKQKKVSCHSFRHSLAQNLIKKGIAVEIVQSILRHSSISTTEIYFKKLQSENMLRIPSNILNL